MADEFSDPRPRRRFFGRRRPDEEAAEAPSSLPTAPNESTADPGAVAAFEVTTPSPGPVEHAPETPEFEVAMPSPPPLDPEPQPAPEPARPPEPEPAPEPSPPPAPPP